MMRRSHRATGLQPNQYTQQFEQILEYPLFLLFYMYLAIREKYMVLFHLFLLQCTTDHSTKNQGLHLFIYFFAHGRSTKLQGPFSFILFFLYCTTIRPKIRVFIDIFLSFAHDHSRKIYDLLFFICSFFVHDHSTKTQCPH